MRKATVAMLLLAVTGCGGGAVEKYEIVEVKRVDAKTEGVPVDLVEIRRKISREQVSGGVGGGEIPVTIDPAPQGNYYLVRIRVSRDYLEAKRKIVNLEARLSADDIAMYSGDEFSFPLFVLKGKLDVATLAELQESDEGEPPKPRAANEYWLTLQIGESQGISYNMDALCLFEIPESSGALSVNVLGGEKLNLDPAQSGSSTSPAAPPPPPPPSE